MDLAHAVMIFHIGPLVILQFFVIETPVVWAPTLSYFEKSHIKVLTVTLLQARHAAN